MIMIRPPGRTTRRISACELVDGAEVDQCVEHGVGVGQRQRIRLMNVDLKAAPARPGAGLADDEAGEVHGGDVSPGTDLARDPRQVSAGAGAVVEHEVAGLELRLAQQPCPLRRHPAKSRQGHGCHDHGMTAHVCIESRDALASGRSVRLDEQRGHTVADGIEPGAIDAAKCCPVRRELGPAGGATQIVRRPERRAIGAPPRGRVRPDHSARSGAAGLRAGNVNSRKTRR
jgi:hypothetical protein